MQILTVVEPLLIQNENEDKGLQYLYPGDDLELERLDKDQFYFVRTSDGAQSVTLHRDEADHYSFLMNVDEDEQ